MGFNYGLWAYGFLIMGVGLLAYGFLIMGFGLMPK